MNIARVIARAASFVAGRCWLLCAFVTMLLALAPFACGGPTFVISQYQGPARPRETIAIIRMEGSSAVQLVSVDGEPLAPIADDVRLHIEVLPGEHSVGVANMAQREQPAQRVVFVAEAGKLYAAAWTAGGARVLEIDAASGAPTRDVTVMEPEEPPVAPQPVAPAPPAQQPPPQPAPEADASPQPEPQPPDAAPPPPP